MRVKVFLGKENAHKFVEASEGQTIESLLKKLRINPQAVIVSRNGEIVTEQETLKDKDSLRIIRVK